MEGTHFDLDNLHIDVEILDVDIWDFRNSAVGMYHMVTGFLERKKSAFVALVMRSSHSQTTGANEVIRCSPNDVSFVDLKCLPIFLQLKA